MEYLLGVIVSLVVQGAKKWGKTDSIITQLILLALAILGAGIYVYLYQTSLWPTFLNVGIAAAAFHNLILRKFE